MRFSASHAASASAVKSVSPSPIPRCVIGYDSRAAAPSKNNATRIHASRYPIERTP
jgi:hypothetical protein